MFSSHASYLMSLARTSVRAANALARADARASEQVRNLLIERYLPPPPTNLKSILYGLLSLWERLPYRAIFLCFVVGGRVMGYEWEGVKGQG